MMYINFKLLNQYKRYQKVQSANVLYQFITSKREVILEGARFLVVWLIQDPKEIVLILL